VEKMDLRQQTQFRVYIEESFQAQKDYGDPVLWKDAKANKWAYAELRGKYGLIYPYSKTQLAATINTKRIYARLPRTWKVIQNGDAETTVFFPDEALQMVASLMKIKKRRQYSKETLARLQKLGKNIGRKAPGGPR
jgi:hypothetical protein